MYVNPNFKTKKALKEAVAAGKIVTIYQPGPFGGNELKNGAFAIEGPYYPEPHKWYANVVVKDGFITKVK